MPMITRGMMGCAVLVLWVGLALPAEALSLNVDVGYDVDGTTDDESGSASSGWTSAFVSYPYSLSQPLSQTVLEDDTGSDVIEPGSSGSASGFAREDGLMWSRSNFYGGFGGDVPSTLGAASGHSGNGLPNEVSFDSQVVWEDTFTNTSSNALPYAFTFEVVGPTLVVEGTAGSEEEAGYEIDIELDGSSVWNSQAVGSYDGTDGIAIDDGFTLAQWGTGIPLESQGGGVWNFEDYEDTVNLGVIGAGDSFTLNYTMNTYVSGSNGPSGMSAQIGDPFELMNNPDTDQYFGSGSVRVVPEPATITLLGLGLLGAATRRRWRSRG